MSLETWDQTPNTVLPVYPEDFCFRALQDAGRLGDLWFSVRGREEEVRKHSAGSRLFLVDLVGTKAGNWWEMGRVCRV